MVTTNDEELGERVRILRTHGAQAKYLHSEVGLNSRLDALQAGILLAKLPHLDEWNSKRAENAAFYDSAFKESAVTAPYRAEYSTHTYNQYTIRISNRDDLKQHLADAGIVNAIYYPLSLHMQKCFANLGYKEGDMPESEKAARETLAIPIYPELTKDMLQYVADTILASSPLRGEDRGEG